MVYLIRHAESWANAGEKIQDLDEMGLTEKGQQQAQEVADNFNEKPDLIIISPYNRTKLTAIPLIKKYPDVPVEVWAVEEFHFIDCEKCKNTNREERLAMAEEYFAQNNLDYVHGKGAESFNQMLKRVDNFLNQIDKSKNIVVFTHGQFIKAILMRINSLPINLETFRKLPEIENTQIIEI